MPRSCCVAIVGATGAVGQEMLDVLRQRRFPLTSLRLFASPRSAGVQIPAERSPTGTPIRVEPLGEGCFRGVDVALFSAGAGVSRQWCPPAAEAGAVVVDNSSAFRMDPGVPLVIPEVNPGALPAPRTPGIIANPNCSTIILLVALHPLHARFTVRRLVVSTYQAVSGAGAQAMEELREQTRAVLAGGAPAPRVFHEPCAFNLFSHNSPVDPRTGLNVEEQKMIAETRRLWAAHDGARVRLTATCVRVPVLRAHCESVNVTFERPATLDQVRRTLEEAPGVRLVDDRAANRFPTPLKASGGDDVLVGRLRADPGQLPDGADPEGPTHAFDLFIAGDQLRKGAALNAVQIAEHMIR